MTTRKPAKSTAKKSTPRKAVKPVKRVAKRAPAPRADVPSLMAFAAPRLTCDKLEELPEWPEILAAYHNGVGASQIRRWLAARGYTLKTLPAESSIARHLRENHARS